WALDAASGRVMKVASNQSFGGTGFSYGDVVRLNFTDNYESVIKSETAEDWILGLEAKDRGAPYARIELAVSKAGGWPLRGTCYARSGAVVKEMAYSGAGEIATGRRPLVVSVTSPLDPGSINALTIVSERPLTLPDAAFNKRNLSARMEEKL
ncbi:MAG: outer membrane lipoprotein-sorting protein, partial [Spirochaetaceae bacterium]|nr:outer membrane lipoprotein-sorting protein [Spirochaetaceae bacterium]